MSAEARTGAQRRVLQHRIRLSKTHSALAAKAGDDTTAKRYARKADKLVAELLSVQASE